MTEAVDRAVAFLASQQRPSGRFLSFVGNGLDLAAPVDDQSVFATALIVGSLADRRHAPLRPALARGARYLAARAETPGVWRFRTPDHPGFHGLPPDADDTACASLALAASGIEPPRNHRALLANRDPDGRFYTWFVPRPTPAAVRSGLWRVYARRARHRRLREPWRGTAAPDDVDAVVNANVLRYLGDGPHAPAVAGYLLAALEHDGPVPPDRWYRSWAALLYAVARCHERGVGGLASAADASSRRVTDAAAAGGRIGAGPQDTALAISALHALGVEGARGATDYLLSSQNADGSWDAESLYFAGEELSWGSRAITTALCLEALLRGSTA